MFQSTWISHNLLYIMYSFINLQKKTTNASLSLCHIFETYTTIIFFHSICRTCNWKSVFKVSSSLLLFNMRLSHTLWSCLLPLGNYPPLIWNFCSRLHVVAKGHKCSHSQILGKSHYKSIKFQIIEHECYISMYVFAIYLNYSSLGFTVIKWPFCTKPLCMVYTNIKNILYDIKHSFFI